MTALTPLQPWIARKIGLSSEALTPGALEAYHLQKLQETLDRCREKSPFYRQRLARAPRTVSSMNDWQAMPFTTDKELRQHPLAFLCVSQSEVERVVTLHTSGTSGRPKRLFFSAADQELTRDFFHTGMSTFTTPGDRVLILLPGERVGSVGHLLRQALSRLQAESIAHGLVSDVAETLTRMEKEEASVVVGVPVQVLALARAATAQKRFFPGVKSVLLTTDHVPHPIIQSVEDAWNCTVYNHYGMTEMGLGGGVECAARQGYHLREADLYFEIIDPLSGERVPDGEPGEIVFTTLTRQAMPLIRYRTGDISRMLPGACSCGTCLRRLEKVRFRWQGRRRLASGHTLTMADLDDALFTLDDVLDFTATLSDDALRLTVQTEMNADKAVRAVRRALRTVAALNDARLMIEVQTQRAPLRCGTKRAFADLAPAGDHDKHRPTPF